MTFLNQQHFSSQKISTRTLDYIQDMHTDLLQWLMMLLQAWAIKHRHRSTYSNKLITLAVNTLAVGQTSSVFVLGHLQTNKLYHSDIQSKFEQFLLDRFLWWISKPHPAERRQLVCRTCTVSCDPASCVGEHQLSQAQYVHEGKAQWVCNHAIPMTNSHSRMMYIPTTIKESQNSIFEVLLVSLRQYLLRIVRGAGATAPKPPWLTQNFAQWRQDRTWLT